jgi:hypothetical protein
VTSPLLNVCRHVPNSMALCHKRSNAPVQQHQPYMRIHLKIHTLHFARARNITNVGQHHGSPQNDTKESSTVNSTAL